MNEEIKNIITEAKNICIIPSEENESESTLNALALFYTLKELGKNVNLIIENFPEKFNFLIPSVDFISSPKNFVISIPKSDADISQVYYEKSEGSLKIHLTLNGGKIKKENVSFYYSQAKPDLIVTLGIKNFQKELSGKLDSFGFLLDSPIINIDTSTPLSAGTQDNTQFGKINIIENNSLSKIVTDIIKSITPNPQEIKGNTASCLLAGLTLYYENFQNEKTTPEIFELCAFLIKQGADRKQIIDELYKPKAQTTAFGAIHTIKS